MFIDQNGKLRKPVAYLADFEMFLPEAPQTIKYWHQMCDRYGIVGYYPGGAPGLKKDYSTDPDSLWGDICNIDISGVENCDFVIAQLDNWRGNQPDSGTAFELGYGLALGKPVYGFYTGAKEIILRNTINKTEIDGELYDENGYGIENQQYPLDNMFRLVQIADSFEHACQLARKDFDKNLDEHGRLPYQPIY